MNLKKVTVYITTYNRLELLKRAVESVLNQSYQNIEIIVADDGSTDGTHAYLNEMQEQGLLLSTINETGKSKGACYGRNKALSLATGYFITGLDDDDYFENWRIETFINYWERASVENESMLAGLFDSMIEITPTRTLITHQKQLVTPQELRTANLIGNQVFTKASYFRKLNGFDETMPALQDWEMWIRLAKAYGSFINISSNSYVVDASHSNNRISEKKASKIEFSFNRLHSKLEPLTLTEKIKLTEAFLTYKQVDISFLNLFYLLIGLRFRVLLRYAKSKVIKK